MKNRFLDLLISASVTTAIVTLAIIGSTYLPANVVNYGVIGSSILFIGAIVHYLLMEYLYSDIPTMRATPKSNLDSKEVEDSWEWATILEEVRESDKKQAKPEPKKRGRKPKAAAPAPKPEPKKRGRKPKK